MARSASSPPACLSAAASSAWRNTARPISQGKTDPDDPVPHPDVARLLDRPDHDRRRREQAKKHNATASDSVQRAAMKARSDASNMIGYVVAAVLDETTGTARRRDRQSGGRGATVQALSAAGGIAVGGGSPGVEGSVSAATSATATAKIGTTPADLRLTPLAPVLRGAGVDVRYGWNSAPDHGGGGVSCLVSADSPEQLRGLRRAGRARRGDARVLRSAVAPRREHGDLDRLAAEMFGGRGARGPDPHLRLPGLVCIIGRR